MKFYDKVKIEIKSGDGGSGAICINKNKNFKKKKCSRLNGVAGGSVYITADADKNNLLEYFYKKKYFATNGAKGSCGFNYKKTAKDIILRVPIGTIIKDLKTNLILFDLINCNELNLLAKGGRGGLGFFLYNINKINLNNNAGLGIIKILELNLKIFSHISLIGFPNTGKSSFFSNVSNLNSKISNYIFTTLNLNKAVLKYKFSKKIIIIDFPGFIKNSYYGLGLGLKFLKHLYRTKIMLHFIDISLLNLKLLYFIKNINIISNEIYRYKMLSFYKCR